MAPLIFPIDLAEQIDQLAARFDRAKGWIIKQALTSWVELEAKREQRAREGLADVNAAHTIDHASITAWAKSLEEPV